MAGVGAAFGTKLKIGTAEVAKLTNIGGLEVSADTKDVTAFDSVDGWREFVSTLKDGGTLPISGFFDGSDTDGQQALFTALGTGASTAMSIVFPTAVGYTWAFNGIVVGFSTGADLEDAVTFDANIKVTGKPTLTATT